MEWAWVFAAIFAAVGFAAVTAFILVVMAVLRFVRNVCKEID